ncbi:MAG: CpXC domain-containing protein [Absicoccus sp.]|uniref:CpXC domain-containing protein n=1 Tax=Absicoccus sp. TaxID=2718527 RepID=UPI002A75A200|nr:CpXC domain-containing protein [Absicoccus sp.]MDY3034704.1 CpXC domain-containing protein [Absicoccus sp.]
MKERMIPSSCPYCHHTFEIKRDTVVIAGMNPKIDQRLEEGTYFTHQCSHCHKLYYLEQPFLYRDPKKKYILILSQHKHIQNLPVDEQIIHCQNALQFLFCFRVLSRNLNLRLVLHKKQQLEELTQKKARFDTYDLHSQCLWFFVDDRLMAIRLNNEEKHDIVKEI